MVRTKVTARKSIKKEKQPAAKKPAAKKEPLYVVVKKSPAKAATTTTTKKVRTRNTKRDSDLVQLGNEPGRNVVIETQPKQGPHFNKGKFLKVASPSKATPTRKYPPRTVASTPTNYKQTGEYSLTSSDAETEEYVDDRKMPAKKSPKVPNVARKLSTNQQSSESSDDSSSDSPVPNVARKPPTNHQSSESSGNSSSDSSGGDVEFLDTKMPPAPKSPEATDVQILSSDDDNSADREAARAMDDCFIAAEPSDSEADEPLFSSEDFEHHRYFSNNIPGATPAIKLKLWLKKLVRTARQILRTQRRKRMRNDHCFPQCHGGHVEQLGSWR